MVCATDVPLIPIDQITATSRPVDPVMTGVYFLIRDGRITYVGQSVNVVLRVAVHSRRKVFDKWSWVGCDAHDLDRVERAYIDALDPIENCDIVTRMRRFVPPPAAALPLPLPTWDWVALKPEECEPSPSVEWMRRLRAIKADPSPRIEDFGPSPFYE